MTEIETVKALECCVVENCEDCKKDWSCVSQWDCMRNLMRCALNLINRIKSDKYLCDGRGSIKLLPRTDIGQIESEAIKEFAERLKEKVDGTETIITAWLEGYIDYLVREMTGV